MVYAHTAWANGWVGQRSRASRSHRPNQERRGIKELSLPGTAGTFQVSLLPYSQWTCQTDEADRTINMQEVQQYWGLLSSSMKDPIQCPVEHMAISPFSMDDYAQFKAESYDPSNNESSSTTSSDKKTSPGSTPHRRTTSRETSERDLEKVSDASVCPCPVFGLSRLPVLTSAIITAVSTRQPCYQ